MDIICGPSAASPAASCVASDKDGLASSSAQSTLWQLLLTVAGEGRNGDRCQVWVSNVVMALTLAGLLLLLRVWWNRGDSPRSDVEDDEPVSGHLIRTPVRYDGDIIDVERAIIAVVGGGSFLSFSSSLSLAGLEDRNTWAPYSIVAQLLSLVAIVVFAPLSRLRRRLSAQEPEMATRRDAFPCPSSTRTDYYYVPFTTAAPLHAPDPIRSVKTTAAHPLPLLHRCPPVGKLIWALVPSIWEACSTAWMVLRMPFSALHAAVVLQRLSSQGSSSSNTQSSDSELLYSLGRANRSEGESADLNVEQQQEQEDLWTALQQIERRYRAATGGQSLYRSPLPRRRSGESAARFTAADEVLDWAAQQLQTRRRSSILAAGVSLCFTTDQRERPLLYDRRGRWIPVAVIDEVGQYYNYRVDQVLPDV